MKQRTFSKPLVLVPRLACRQLNASIFTSKMLMCGSKLLKENPRSMYGLFEWLDSCIMSSSDSSNSQNLNLSGRCVRTQTG